MFYGNSNLDLEGLFGKLLSNGRPMYSVLSTNNVETEESYEVNHTKDGAYLFFNAPGFNKSNLKVEIEDGIMYLEGKRTYKLNGEDVIKTLAKQFKIGTDYNSSSIEATIEDGLLTVFVPNYRKQEKKRISVL
jgi:HSP20 family molecular chaperone IbpA